MASPSREARIQELGRAILATARDEEKKKEAHHKWEMALLEWCMENEELRNRAFRFIDVFPSLKTPQAVFQHIQEYFPKAEHRLPPVLRAGLALTQPSFLTRPLLNRVTRELYLRMANLFIGARNEEEALEKFRLYARQDVRLSIDLLGEKTTHEEEADAYEARYRGLILALGREKKGRDFQNISVKLSALEPQFSPLAREKVIARTGERLKRLLRLAKENDVFVHVDMEDYETRDLTLDVVDSVVLDEEFRSGVSIGVVLQAYLRDASECCDRMIALSRLSAIPLTIRLVRGAYWDSEIMKSRELHWPIPVWTSKEETDATFEQLLERILSSGPQVRLAVATHNVRSLAAAWALAEEKEIPADRFEFQCLYGMGEPFIPALKPSGYPVRFYMPIGDPVIGMAYLVRRLLENVSSQSFVRRGFYKPEQAEQLLSAPAELLDANEPQMPAAPDFDPLAPLAFHDRYVRQNFQKALDKVRRSLGETLPLVIGGKERSTPEKIKTVSPVDGHTPAAVFSCAGSAEVQTAVASAVQLAAKWADLPVSQRAECLRRAADLMTLRRYELAALTVWEAGKTWREADAEIVEAVDFLRFYAHCAERMMTEAVAEDLDQETNRLAACPRGVTAVISPWNFPAAILTGMSSAALVAGNPVILKPAEQSTRVAWEVYKIYREAGIPEYAVHFLPGRGESAGDALVRHPDVAVIAFTGSRETGLSILSVGNEKKIGQKLVKRFVVEMGGKNPAIVDASADFDLAVPAVLQSAFGYAGQKCSALSRLYVVDEAYDEFLKRLAGAAREFCLGSPLLSASSLGPVIDREAQDKIQGFIELGKKEGKILFEGVVPDGVQGPYIPPIIFSELPQTSRLLSEEIFGPVLCIIRASNFTEALKMAGDSEYALTAAVYSRTPSHLEMARKTQFAGNLYLNRGQTGAVVGRQPFGGFKLSGGGTKAGGADYLREFYFLRTVSENVSRHGFAPLHDESSNETK